MSVKHNIVIPIGDIAGVGPEIVVKALNYPEVYEWCNPVVVGERTALERALQVTGMSLNLQEITDTKSYEYKYGIIPFFNLKMWCI